MAARKIMAVDFGASRVGLALASTDLNISYPLTTLSNDDKLIDAIKQLTIEHKVDELVVGLPRGLDGNETKQTGKARDFAYLLKQQLGLTVYLMDEAATSVEAEASLKQSGKPYAKADIDSLAAAIILDNYLSSYEAN